MPLNAAKDSIFLRDVKLSIGSSTGSDLYHRMRKAKERVLVVSPYLDERSDHLLNCLLELHDKGVEVDLVTMEDSVRKRGRIKTKTVKKLISQKRDRDEAAVTRRRRGMLWSALSGIGAVGMAIGLNGLSPWVPLGWFLLPVAVIVFLIYWNRGIYRYKYKWTLGENSTRLLPSHYQSDTECPFLHAKLYVIDSKVAFLGSLNFTTRGLFDNFETCVRVDRIDDVRALEILINGKLKETGSWSFPPSDLGAWLVDARVWREPRAV